MDQMPDSGIRSSSGRSPPNPLFCCLDDRLLHCCHNFALSCGAKKKWRKAPETLLITSSYDGFRELRRLDLTRPLGRVPQRRSRSEGVSARIKNLTAPKVQT